MTTLFTDTFNRPNGALGGAWIVPAGSVVIDTNRAHSNAAGSCIALNPVPVLPADHAVSVTIKTASSGANGCGAVVRSDAGVANAYFASYVAANTGSTPRLFLARYYAGVLAYLAGDMRPPGLTQDRLLTLRATGSAITVSIDGVTYIAVTDTTIASGAYAGMYFNQATGYITPCVVYDAAGAGLSVSPGSLLVGQSQQTLTLTNLLTNWTPGTPGSPLFTAQFGRIVSQTVVNNHTATLVYTPANWPNQDTLIDPLNGTNTVVSVGAAAAGGGPTPPLWPGLSGVTLGTPVAISNGAAIPGPLHGVIVSITAVPNGTGKLVVGSKTLYTKRLLIGWVCDNGSVGEYQWADWNAGLYSPRSLKEPASAVIWSATGVTGTVTPWTVN